MSYTAAKHRCYNGLLQQWNGSVLLIKSKSSARTIKGPPEDTSSAGTCVTNEEGQNNRPNRQRTTSVTFAYSDDAAAARDRERESHGVSRMLLRRPYKDPTTDGNILSPFARIPYSARYANLHWHGTCHPWHASVNAADSTAQHSGTSRT